MNARNLHQIQRTDDDKRNAEPIPRSVRLAAGFNAWLTALEDMTRPKAQRAPTNKRHPRPASSPSAPRRGRRTSRSKGTAPTVARRNRRRRTPNRRPHI